MRQRTSYKIHHQVINISILSAMSSVAMFLDVNHKSEDFRGESKIKDHPTLCFADENVEAQRGTMIPQAPQIVVSEFSLLGLYS